MTSAVAQRLVIADRAAELLAAELSGSQPVLGLATGSTMEPVYAELAALVSANLALRDGIQRAQGFALDQYVGLPAGDPNSYLATLEREMAVPGGLPPGRLHVPAATASRSAPREGLASSFSASAATGTSASTSPVRRLTPVPG